MISRWGKLAIILSLQASALKKQTSPTAYLVIVHVAPNTNASNKASVMPRIRAKNEQKGLPLHDCYREDCALFVLLSEGRSSRTVWNNIVGCNLCKQQALNVGIPFCTPSR